MDKQDLMYGVAAVAVILVMALVVKPMMTGHPVNTGIPVPSAPTTLPVPTGVPAPSTTPIPTPIPTTPVPTTLTAVPTPPPTWNNQVQSIGFVNSSQYGIPANEEIPNSSRFDSFALNTTTVSYARISGQYSGTTQVISIPSPYWELVYTVDPVPASKPGSVAITPTKGGVGLSGVQGSYSGVMPEFTIQVMDAQDPNRIVRTISPPGGIDINLWKGVKATINPEATGRTAKLTTSADTPYNDPRPWTEKFFEGQQSYYFIISSQLIKSYTIDIRVPSRYIGTF